MMKEVHIVEKDPDQLRCTTSSSCKRSCLVLFITIQFCIICILGFTLRNIRTVSEGNIVPKKIQESDGYYWLALPDRMKKLNENPVYAKFNISRQENRPKVNLLILVSSAPKRGDRRSAIRDTWWNQSYANDKVRTTKVFVNRFFGICSRAPGLAASPLLGNFDLTRKEKMLLSSSSCRFCRFKSCKPACEHESVTKIWVWACLLEKS